MFDDVFDNIFLGIDRTLIDEYEVALLVQYPVSSFEYEIVLCFVLKARCSYFKISLMAQVMPLVLVLLYPF